ncbi:Putative hydrolase-like protein [Cladobotryum mycophilum]|uniref:Hydrolase-like protein n=1 Tax=Cladobotryum mycophilum TaxID=491253 RepID=A0ABR0S8F0_9HYPO
MHSSVKVGLALAATVAAQGPPGPPPTFDWSTITPATDLVYHDCYGTFKCARLQLPLNWLNVSDPRTVAIAMIKLPATVPEDDPTFGGSLFINPGGPGGSGVDFSVQIAPLIQGVVVDKPNRHYEIVSFDPRGVTHSTPVVDCLHGNLLARDALAFEVRGNGPLNSGLSTINYGLALTDSFNKRCLQTDQQFGQIMAFAGTPNVARDMVEMVDKIDALRKQNIAHKRGITVSELEKRNGTAGPDTTPRLQYMGYSYGTFLANTFAALYPGRVGRLILDGVVDAVDYANGPGWLKNVLDVDNIFTEFYKGCYAAGPSVCALARPNELPAVGIARFAAWTASLDQNPLPVTSPTGSVMVLTGNDIRTVVGKALYTPVNTFMTLAAALNQAMNGNPTALDACPTASNPNPQPLFVAEQASAILCNDGDSVNGKSSAYWLAYVNTLVGQSKIYGTFWSTIRFACASWPFTSNWVYKGPFTAPKANPALVPGIPAAPILFLNNRLDPATPLVGARAMSALHPDSALVIQEQMGHTTLLNGQGPCVQKIIQDYLETGKVPTQKETICQPACTAWNTSCAVPAPPSTRRRDLSSHGLQDENGFLRSKTPLGLI